MKKNISPINTLVLRFSHFRHRDKIIAAEGESMRQMTQNATTKKRSKTPLIVKDVGAPSVLTIKH